MSSGKTQDLEEQQPSVEQELRELIEKPGQDQNALRCFLLPKHDSCESGLKMSCASQSIWKHRLNAGEKKNWWANWWGSSTTAMPLWKVWTRTGSGVLAKPRRHSLCAFWTGSDTKWLTDLKSKQSTQLLCGYFTYLCSLSLFYQRGRGGPRAEQVDGEFQWVPREV